MLAIKSPPELLKSTIILPGSKYVANRILIMAALSDQKIQLNNIPLNQDIEVAQKGLEKLGVKIKTLNEEKTAIEMVGIGNKVGKELGSLLSHLTEAELYTHESGTFSRFVVAMAALFKTPTVINAAPKMCERPMEDLTDVLRGLGVSVEFIGNINHLPIKVTGPIQGGHVKISGSISSQYISALLMILPLLPTDSKLEVVDDLVSKSFVDLTISLLKKFQIEIEIEKGSGSDSDNLTPTYLIKGHQKYQPVENKITVESDPVSSTYFLALAALKNQPILINHFNFASPQGEVKFHELLTQMGATIATNPEENKLEFITLENQLKGIEVDMGDMPDAVPTLTILAAVAKGKTIIKNIAHLRYKESNRIDDLAEELRKAGVDVQTTHDSMTIKGGNISSSLSEKFFSSHNDHRLAMSLTLLATKSDNSIVLSDWQAVNKSFPTYFEKLKELGFYIDEN